MTNPTDVENMIGRNAIDSDGNKIGKIGQVYLDDQTGSPQWVTVKTGMFGSKETFAPLYGSQSDGDDLRLAVSKDMVKDAPNMDADGHLDDSENDALYSHYAGHLGDEQRGVQQHGEHNHDDDSARADKADRTTDRATEGHDTSGPNTDDAMTRSEERLRVGTESVQTGRARLRKYVVTEDVSTTVPVSHEEVRVDREPITDANRGDALSGGDITEEEHEVTLHAERPVVQKETVPVERVKMSTDTVTEDQTVTEQVRKEQIDTPDADQR